MTAKEGHPRSMAALLQLHFLFLNVLLVRLGQSKVYSRSFVLLGQIYVLGLLRQIIETNVESSHSHIKMGL